MLKQKTTQDLPTTTNTNVEVTDLTPIEIALQIDENGMTSLKNLYDFLQLDKSHYTKWCKRNIIDNPFAVENVDYISFRPKCENPNGGRPTTEYKLTSDFAKQLSMTVKNERGQEARKYFIACEQGLKVATQKIQNYKPVVNLQPMIDAITALSQNMATMQQDIQEIKQARRNRYFENRHPSAWYKKIAPKYKLLMEHFDCTRSELYSNIYKELEDTCNVDINQLYEDYCYENHLLKEDCYPMDAIEHDTRLRNALTSLIDTSLVKYGLMAENEVKNYKRPTLFDRESN